MSPTQRVSYGALKKDFTEFKKGLAEGGKLLSIFLPEIYRKPDFIKYYISVNSDLSDSVKRRFGALSSKQKYKEYPRGYKQWRVLDFLQQQRDKGASKEEIIKLAYELSYGRGSFDPVINNAYWHEIFKEFYSAPKWFLKSTRKNKDKYVINDYGKQSAEKLRKKFEPQNIKAYV